MGLYCSPGPERWYISGFVCVKHNVCLLCVRGSQIPGVCTLSPDTFSMNIQFFLTKSSHAPSRKHQITGSQVSLELQVLIIEHISCHPSSALNLEVACKILENLWNPAFFELFLQDCEHVGPQTLFFHWAWKWLKLALELTWFFLVTKLFRFITVL